MFKNINPNSLTTKWNTLDKNIHERLKVFLDRRVDHHHHNADVATVLKFLKSFPVHRLKFERAVDSFIVFSDARLASEFRKIHSNMFISNNFRIPRLSPKV